MALNISKEDISWIIETYKPQVFAIHKDGSFEFQASQYTYIKETELSDKELLEHGTTPSEYKAYKEEKEADDIWKLISHSSD